MGERLNNELTKIEESEFELEAGTAQEIRVEKAKEIVKHLRKALNAKEYSYLSRKWSNLEALLNNILLAEITDNEFVINYATNGERFTGFLLNFLAYLHEQARYRIRLVNKGEVSGITTDRIDSCASEMVMEIPAQEKIKAELTKWVATNC